MLVPRFQSARVWVHRWSRSTLGLLFPPACAFCGAGLPARGVTGCFCSGCRARLLPGDLPDRCSRCGAALKSGLAFPDGCPRCRNRDLRFRSAVSLGQYDGELRRAVLRMKKPAGETLAIALAQLLYERQRRHLAEFGPDRVVPIPMHWSRRLARGTNGPEVLAEVLAGRMRVPFARRLLGRRRKTLPQFSLSPPRRFKNLRGAFRVRAGYHLNAARVLLVDDILTTGATCREATKTLQRAGAADVAVAVIARAEGDERV